jgi:hypothetical protein
MVVHQMKVSEGTKSHSCAQEISNYSNWKHKENQVLTVLSTNIPTINKEKVVQTLADAIIKASEVNIKEVNTKKQNKKAKMDEIMMHHKALFDLKLEHCQLFLEYEINSQVPDNMKNRLK